jgi:DNA-binding transcriptional ArsR family regulator
MHDSAMNDSDLDGTHAQPVLACLGVASRFRLVMALAVADRCVGELARVVGLSQSCTTRHLQALERVGLVKGSREGRRVRFRLRAEAPGLSELLDWVLSESGLEALVGGTDHQADRVVPALAGPSSRATQANAASRALPTGATGPRRKAPIVPTGEPKSGDRMVQLDQEEAKPQVVAGSRPAWRPDDLEDYLL